MSIPQHRAHVQGFAGYYRRCFRQATRDRYYAVARSALSLPGSHWYLYSLIAVLANFTTRIADLAYRSRVLRSWRSKRQINRILGDLVQRGYICQHGRKLYSLTGRTQRRDNARLRPINAHILLAASDESTGLYARFLVSLAWNRLPWCRWTWRTVQKTLKIDTGTAQQLYQAFQAIRDETTRKTLRKVVFWSVRPEWYLYRDLAGGVIYDPRSASRGQIAPRAGPGGSGPMSIAEICRSGNVPPQGGSVSLLWVVGESSLASTAGTGRNGGGRPAQETRRQRDRDLAATAARRIRPACSPATRHARIAAGTAANIDRATPGVYRIGPAGPDPNVAPKREIATATNPPGSGSPPREDLPAGSLFDQLVAGLPADVRQRFEKDPATRSIRSLARIQRGYKC